MEIDGSRPDGRSIDSHIRERLSALTPLEARVISAIVNQHSIDAQTPIKSVAQETGVSQAMLVKIAKKLGFDGFCSLRAVLAEYNRLPLNEIRQELNGYQSTSEIVEKVRLSSRRALETTFSSRSLEWLEAAAKCIWSARQRDLYGMGGAAHLARDAAFKFLRIGIRTSVFDDGCMMLMSASLLQKGDVAVAFSYSNENLTVLNVARQARRNGATVIAITNGPASMLAREANFALHATVDESPLTGETAAARMAQLSILDALFVAVARISPAATETNLGCTMSALRVEHPPL